jgi:VWFA-related protein
MLSRRSLLLSMAPLLRAQQETTFSTDVKVINVLATVRTRQGEIVRDLAKDDFTIVEDGRAQTIRYFSRETNLPLTLGLLVDTSGSQRRVLGAERTASYKFIEQVLREDKDMAFLIRFDREVELLQDLTSSRKKLEQALSEMESPQMRQASGGRGGSRGGRGGGGTSLNDSVLLAADEIMKNQKGRKALILLSDGVDNGSKVSLATAIESSQRADTMAYSVLFSDDQAYARPVSRGGYGGRRGGMRIPPTNGGSRAGDGKKTLQRLAKETGGGFFEVSKKQPIEKVFERIEEELRNQYSLGYSSDRTDAGANFRRIEVSVKRQGVIVQARDGYYPAS